VQKRSVAARRRRLALRAASGSGQIAYHGSSHAVERSSASVAQPACVRQSAPRAVSHSVSASTAANRPTNTLRHHPGSPTSPNRRAVSAGIECTAISCCCPRNALTKPNACEPKPSTATIASAARQTSTLTSRPRRSRARAGASTRKGSTSPAEALTPTAATSAPPADL
jgi:hypothetical protein